MSADETHAFISDVFALAGRYNRETLRSARRYVRSSMRGSDRDALLALISALEPLAERRDQVAQIEPRKNRSSSFEEQETFAILQDHDFLPSRVELIALLKETLGDDAPRLTHKDSRDYIVRKALHAFEELAPARKEKIFKMLRKRFIDARGSSLKAWSEIISK